MNELILDLSRFAKGTTTVTLGNVFRVQHTSQDQIDLECFIGGQAEIQRDIHHDIPKKIFRGEVDTITLQNDGGICLIFSWLALLDLGNAMPWTKIEPFQHTIETKNFSANNIGPSPRGGGDRLYFHNIHTEDAITLFPLDGSKMDPNTFLKFR